MNKAPSTLTPDDVNLRRNSDYLSSLMENGHSYFKIGSPSEGNIKVVTKEKEKDFTQRELRRFSAQPPQGLPAFAPSGPTLRPGPTIGPTLRPGPTITLRPGPTLGPTVPAVPGPSA